MLQVWHARWPYAMALVLDFFLRFIWTLTLAPGSTPFGSLGSRPATELGT
jgi:hypothetical protein